LTSAITTFAAISYYAMAIGDGITLRETMVTDHHKHGVPNTHHSLFREVYWARYVDWSLTTPLILVDLALLAGLNGANITIAVLADLIVVLTGLFAALTTGTDRARWGYYAMSCIAYLVVLYQLTCNGRQKVRTKDKKTALFYTLIAGFTIILWTIYLIIWGVTDSSISVKIDCEIMAYAVLDVLAKPVFGFWLLFTHDAMAESSSSIEGFWSHGLSSEGAIRVGEDDA